MKTLTDFNRMRLEELVECNEGTQVDLFKIDSLIASIALECDVDITLNRLDALSGKIYDAILEGIQTFEEPKGIMVFDGSDFIGYRNDEGELI